MTKLTVKMLGNRLLCLLVLCWGFDSVAAEISEEEAPKIQDGAASVEQLLPSSPQQLIAMVHDGDDVVAARALKRLTEDAQSTRANLPALLSEARVATGRIDTTVLSKGIEKPWWVFDARTKASLILACVVDSVRETGTDAEREDAIRSLKPLVAEALEGRIPEIPAPFAVEAYYLSAFYPPEMHVSPGSVPEDILLTLKGCLKHANPEVRQHAASLLTGAAYDMPSRREELLNYLDAHLEQKEAQECREYIGLLDYRVGPAVSKETYLSIKKENEEGLLTWLEVNDTGGGPEWNLYVNELRSRLGSLPNRCEILSRILARGALAYRLSILLSRPISEDADALDKKFVDTLIEFYETQIAASKRDKYSPDWAIKGLRLLVVEDMERVGPGLVLLPQPYARDRVVLALLAGLGADSPEVQDAAARALGSVSWLGKEPARAALVGLKAMRDHIEQNYDLSRPDSEFPFKGEWSERPEKYIHDTIMASIREAELALQYFEEDGS